MSGETNVCAGPFGAVYAYYMEQEWLGKLICRTIWGARLGPMYESMYGLSDLPPGATVLDVPCGGGIALRGLSEHSEVRYVAVDISADMLARAQRRADERGLTIETVVADMRRLPFEDGFADVCLTYSGLHMLDEPEQALLEVARCLKAGGELIGSTFTTEGSRRQRAIFELGRRRGDPGPMGDRPDLERWLAAAGIGDVELRGSDGFLTFSGRKMLA